MPLTNDQKIEKLWSWRKEVKREIQDIWDRINGESNAVAEFADETRDIAERARRLAQRVKKQLDELEEE